MNSILRGLRTIFGIELRPKTRLSDEQAMEIAAAYVKAGNLGWDNTHLGPFEVRHVDGALVWTLRTNTVGSWLTVDVDDATGEVLGHKRHGIR